MSQNLFSTPWKFKWSLLSPWIDFQVNDSDNPGPRRAVDFKFLDY